MTTTSAYTRQQALNELADTEIQAQECRDKGIDDGYYEDHASFLRGIIRDRRKKAIILTHKVAFLSWYKGLNINDKIAFKTWIYYYGRGRIRLMDLLKYTEWWKNGIIARENAIDDGYNILWSRPWPDLQRWSKFVPR